MVAERRALAAGVALAFAFACRSPEPPAPPSSRSTIVYRAPTALRAPQVASPRAGAPAASGSTAAPAPPAAAPALEPAGAADTGSALPECPADMLPVPGGTFVMGADHEGEEDERPAHAVTVETFLLDRTEVTNAAYAECVARGACTPAGAVAASFGARDKDFRGPEQPVVGVSWFQAKRYCEFRGKRLPREAEWERAARGADGRRYAWGNEPPDPRTLACFGRNPRSPGGTTMPAGSYPNGQGPYGHLDLTGNVWEWVEDVYDPLAYRREGASRGVPGSCDDALRTQDELRRAGKQGFTGRNPIPTTCERVLRGGAFNYRGSGLRASNRVHHPPEWQILVAGFRCARDP